LTTSHNVAPTGVAPMATATAKQIANWIVHYSWNDLGAPVDAMSLEKLLYYAQAFHLVLHDTPLFSDEILAWQKGPVVGAVYAHYAGFGWNPIIPDEDAPAEALSTPITEFLKQIISFFGRYTAIPLSQATHSESPWADAREGRPPNVASGGVIRQLDMKAYYRALIDEGEAALSRQDMLGVLQEPRWAALYVAGICARHMISHPFYDATLAKRLSESIQSPPLLGDDFYKPPREREFIEFKKGDTVEAMLKRKH
jgi:uncharacterized phage-associated protein